MVTLTASFAPLVFLGRPGRSADTLSEAMPSPTTLLRLELDGIGMTFFFLGEEPLNEKDLGILKKCPKPIIFHPLKHSNLKFTDLLFGPNSGHEFGIFQKTLQFHSKFWM